MPAILTALGGGLALSKSSQAIAYAVVQEMLLTVRHIYYLSLYVLTNSRNCYNSSLGLDYKARSKY